MRIEGRQAARMFSSSLFPSRPLREYIQGIFEQIRREIRALPDSEIARADADTLADQIVRPNFVECPTIQKDDIYPDEAPQVRPGEDVPLTFNVPFTGDPNLFGYSGGSAPVITERVEVRPGELVVSIRQPPHALAQVKGRVDVIIKRIIEEGLGPIRRELEHHNPNMREEAANLIRHRQRAYASQQAATQALESIGYRVRRRNDAPAAVAVPVKPKPIAVPARPATPASKPPNYDLPLADYDEILRVISDMVKVFERSPSVFRAMDEEALRTILLVALNGVFQGGATAETFNGAGKTDILIRAGGDNIFIAECLIWAGPEHFRKKLTEQLFNYSTWRDSKLAAVIFNRGTKFSTVLSGMTRVVAELPNLRAELPYSNQTGCRHRLHRADDPLKDFLLTCLAFEVPT